MNNSESVGDVLLFGPFRFDRASGQLQREGVEVPLTAKSEALLGCLVERPGEVLLKEELLRRIWGDTSVTDHSLTEAMRALRKTLGDDPRRPRYIQTAHRKGYRFIAEVSAGDLIPESAGSVGTPGAAEPRPRRRLLALAGAVAGVSAVVLLLGGGGHLLPGEPDAVRRFDLIAPGGIVFGGNALSAGIALSNDGMTVAYLGRDEELGRAIYVRRLDRDVPIRIPTVESPYQPALSPDGRTVAFFEWLNVGSGNKSVLKVAATEGGTPFVLADGLIMGGGATFAPDGTIIFASSQPPGIWRVPADGSAEPALLFEPDPDTVYYWPQVLPDGDTVIATAHRFGVEGLTRKIVALSLADGTQHQLLEGGGRARLTADGRLLVGRDGQLFATSMGAPLQEITARLVPVRHDVATLEPSGYAAFDVAEDGTLIYLRDRRVPDSYRLDLVSSSGEAEMISEEVPSAIPALSPDGRRAAFVMWRNGMRDVYVADLELGGAPTQVTFGQWATMPIWTPEGNRLTYNRRSGGNYDLYSSVVGTREAEPLLRNDHSKYPSSWSPDGQLLAYSENHPETGSDVWFLPMSTREPVPFLRTPDHEWGAVFSPDGQWIAYHTNEGGSYEVWIRPVPEDLANHDPDADGPAWRVSTECGAWPTWSHDGTQVFFRDCHGYGAAAESFWAATVEMGANPVIHPPRVMFRGNYGGRVYGSPTFSVTSDGRLLLATRVLDGETEEEELHLVLVQNWFVELEELVVAGR